MKLIFILLIILICSIIYKIIKYTIYKKRNNNTSKKIYNIYEIVKKKNKIKRVKFADEVNISLETLIPPNIY